MYTLLEMILAYRQSKVIDYLMGRLRSMVLNLDWEEKKELSRSFDNSALVGGVLLFLCQPKSAGDSEKKNTDASAHQ